MTDRIDRPSSPRHPASRPGAVFRDELRPAPQGERRIRLMGEGRGDDGDAVPAVPRRGAAGAAARRGGRRPLGARLGGRGAGRHLGGGPPTCRSLAPPAVELLLLSWPGRCRWPCGGSLPSRCWPCAVAASLGLQVIGQPSPLPLGRARRAVHGGDACRPLVSVAPRPAYRGSRCSLGIATGVAPLSDDYVYIYLVSIIAHGDAGLRRGARPGPGRAGRAARGGDSSGSRRTAPGPPSSRSRHGSPARSTTSWRTTSA